MRSFKSKLARSFLALGITLAAASPAQAEESAAGGLEFSGNASVLAGWQRDDSAALGTLGGEFALVRGPRAPNRDTFNFYLDEIELDLQKTFGEKVRLVVNLDFGRAFSGSIRSTEGSNFVLEQAYGTFGIGNGEVLVGRFNVPVGYYVVDRVANPTISFSSIYDYLTPANATGAKVYWSFGDHWDMHAYVVNQMFDCLFTSGCLVGPTVSKTATEPGSGDSAVPSWGTRIGYNWGEEGNKSTIGLSYIGGPEQPGHNAHLDHLFDLDFAFHVTENFLLAGEGIYYQRNNVPGIVGPNAKFAGALLVADWKLSDIWNLFGSYGYVHDVQGVVTGADMQVHNVLVGFGYQIIDNAKFKMEYRLDFYKYAGVQGERTAFAGALADTTSFSNGIAAELGYTF